MQYLRWARTDAKYTGPETKVGIEIESEAMLAYSAQDVISSAGVGMTFTAKEDGSLRNFGIEYVSEPLVYSKAKQETTKLLKKLREVPTIINPCPRAGVHVHVNVRDLSIPEIWTMACAYWLVEDPLVTWCGPSRVGNNFCLRLKDATRILGTAVNAVRNDFSNLSIQTSFGCFSPGGFKYAALNLATVYSLGTLEFRALDGTLDDVRINHWIDQVVKFKALALEFGTPEKLFSWLDNELDKKKVYEKILTPYFYSQLDIAKMCDTIYTSASFPLSIAYACPDWDQYNKALYNKYMGEKPDTPPANLDDDFDNMLRVLVDGPIQDNNAQPVVWEEHDEEEVA